MSDEAKEHLAEFMHQYLAAYLLAHGLELVNVDRDSFGLDVFVFRDTVEREDLVRAFRYGPEAPVDARHYALAISQLQRPVERIHQEQQPDLSLDP